MTRISIDKSIISEQVEGLTLKNLKSAYKRYKSSTSRFRHKNVRDPLDHIDFEVNLSNELYDIKEQIQSGNYYPKRPQVHWSPKSKGIGRPIVSLHIEDAIVYRFCIEQIDNELIKITRQKNIRGGVMASPLSEPVDGEYYEKWFSDWMEHNDAVRAALDSHEFIATTDISSYFDNIEIQVLSELLRSSIPAKDNLVSLLNFFLQNVKLRYGYKTTLNTGLIQDDSDCSRILAYFYLHLHDVTMISFANSIEGHYFRYVDDMNLVVKTETQAKQALRTVTQSLRRLGLMASIEKTQISSNEIAIREMCHNENLRLSDLDERISDALNKDTDTTELEEEFKTYYRELVQGGFEKHPKWIKLLRRFYTLATNMRSDMLLDDVSLHLIHHPSLITSGKIQRYLIASQSVRDISGIVENILAYLESDENLYPQAETELVELLCSLRLAELSLATQVKVQDIAYRLVTSGEPRPLIAQSEYSRGLAVFLLYKCDKSKNAELADMYLSRTSYPEYFRKCLAIVALTTPNHKKSDSVLRKLRKEISPEMKRLLNLVEGLDTFKSSKIVKNYLEKSNFYLYFSEFKDSKGKTKKKEIILDFPSVRSEIIIDLIAAHG